MTTSSSELETRWNRSELKTRWNRSVLALNAIETQAIHNGSETSHFYSFCTFPISRNITYDRCNFIQTVILTLLQNVTLLQLTKQLDLPVVYYEKKEDYKMADGRTNFKKRKHSGKQVPFDDVIPTPRPD